MSKVLEGGIRESDNRMWGRHQMGVYVLTEPKVFRNNYECAAWYQDVEVPAGEYPMIGVFEAGVLQWIVVGFTGTITGSDFTSFFGGNSFGKAKVDEDKGKEGRAGITARPYEVANEIAEHPNTAWRLNEDWSTEYRSNITHKPIFAGQEPRVFNFYSLVHKPTEQKY